MRSNEMPSLAPESGAEDQLAQAISQSKSFDELFEALDNAGKVSGSEKDYSADKLKARINELLEAFKAGAKQDGIIYQRLIRSITRTGGLRDKVAELLENEQ
jgi:predicted DNA binding CopG/RHH family protein